ncbi:glycosyltransferase [Rubritalea profundi]|uniref:Glycosyltransferase 2-like domain-containing protein n=1 Tax=Rubritalea profundi TaxID=1658618 RepID=A0A2S7U761_9BACT|nr:glycosyltransferase [Rubritalea profundi]PQJ30142.1 hypothetical protein BSZ32_17795 [Rubritalea profundi]
MPSIEKKYDMPSIAVIIPTFNESDFIDKCLLQPALQDFNQVIVVDGGSTDDTREKLRALPKLTLLNCEVTNRAAQMNLGADANTCDLLLFLHADTLLPANTAQLLRKQFHNGKKCGCFNRQFTPASVLLDFTSEMAYWRSDFSFGAMVTKLYFSLKNYSNNFQAIVTCAVSKTSTFACVQNE